MALSAPTTRFRGTGTADVRMAWRLPVWKCTVQGRCRCHLAPKKSRRSNRSDRSLRPFIVGPTGYVPGLSANLEGHGPEAHRERRPPALVDRVHFDAVLPDEPLGQGIATLRRCNVPAHVHIIRSGDLTAVCMYTHTTCRVYRRGINPQPWPRTSSSQSAFAFAPGFSEAQQTMTNSLYLRPNSPSLQN